MTVCPQFNDGEHFVVNLYFIYKKYSTYRLNDLANGVKRSFLKTILLLIKSKFSYRVKLFIFQ